MMITLLKKKIKCKLLDFARHPCAGAMLIFSVLFQFNRWKLPQQELQFECDLTWTTYCTNMEHIPLLEYRRIFAFSSVETSNILLRKILEVLANWPQVINTPQTQMNKINTCTVFLHTLEFFWQKILYDSCPTATRSALPCTNCCWCGQWVVVDSVDWPLHLPTSSTQHTQAIWWAGLPSHIVFCYCKGGLSKEALKIDLWLLTSL